MLKLTRPITLETAHILTKDALDFVGKLVAKFDYRRYELLERRRQFDELTRKGRTLKFRFSTAKIRESDWKVIFSPPDLFDRRVEITGPSSNAKMVINAFNSGAKVYMSDFEDSETPTWNNLMQGQVNLYDAVREKITYALGDKQYKLNQKHATLMVRPRGLHLNENHILIDGQIPVSASLVDFGLFFFHNAKELIARGSGPYFYLPKIEHYEEAEWWANVFAYAEEFISLPKSNSPTWTRATVLIETIPAAFEMDEILYALREYSAGLNCGRWDYIFSFIKKLGHNPQYVMPDRSQIGMDQHFLRNYAQLLVKTCHRRGAHAIGGMSAYIPVKGDEDAHKQAMKNVAKDKLREVKQGFDGTWVAHPGLVLLALDVFDPYMPTPNQIHNLRDDVRVTTEDLLRVPQGFISRDGIRTNIRVALTYIESWLRGIGCVPIDNLMEDLATAEISRVQLWQWLHTRILYRVRDDLSPPVPFTKDAFEMELQATLEEIKEKIGLEKMLAGKYVPAVEALRHLMQMTAPIDFLPQWINQILQKEEEAGNV